MTFYILKLVINAFIIVNRLDFNLEVGFIIFLFLWKKRTSISVVGSLFFTYLILAGVERFFIEFIRLNSKYIFIFSGAQVISVLMIIIGTYFLMNPPNGNVQETES